jgi:arylsulfatase A-like enzyme
LLWLVAPGALSAQPARPPAQRLPNVLVVSIDTLRADRLSAYGYRRPTSPAIDRLLASGVRFDQARTVEPLTNPSLCSLWTSLYPHQHGATRNGLRLRPGLASLSGVLRRRGYKTAGIVGSWPLRDRISGLGEHFQDYREILNRKRWFGMFRGESTAEDLTDEALAWLSEQKRGQPFLLWVHYVEPHAPYRLQKEFLARLGLSGLARHGEIGKSDRYDTEIAFADHHVGRLLAAIERDPQLAAETLIVFLSDHGESLGEHGTWGHGRDLYEPTLRIPMGIAWPGKIASGGKRPRTISTPATQLDLAPTVLGLIGLPIPPAFQGFDWSGVLLRGEPAPHRKTWHQAHRGLVFSGDEAHNARRRGLLEVAVFDGTSKEILRVERPESPEVRTFDLATDPGEVRSGQGRKKARAKKPSPELERWLAEVRAGLTASDDLPADVDPESIERLRALGYVQGTGAP